MGGHSSPSVASAMGPGSKTQAEGWESNEGVWAPHESADVGFSTCSSESQQHPDAIHSQESQQEHLHVKARAEQWTTLHEGYHVLLVMFTAAAVLAAWYLCVKHQNIFSQMA